MFTVIRLSVSNNFRFVVLNIKWVDSLTVNPFLVVIYLVLNLQIS